MHRLLITLMPAVITFAGCRTTVPGAIAPPPPIGGRITALIGSALGDGMQLVYESAGVEQAPWVYDSMRVVERAAFDRCVVVARVGQEPRESCMRGDTLFEQSAAGGHTAVRPIGANMTLTVTAASGNVLEYATEDVRLLRTADGMDLPIVRTTILTRNPAGTIIRRLREDYAPTLLTAARGVFEEPDDDGGWRTTRAFALSVVPPAEPEPGTSDPSSTPRAALRWRAPTADLIVPTTRLTRGD